MTIDTVASQTCGRCGGTGRYSFNLIDGDRCYGCGGSGRVPMTPKGQKAIKPTAELRNCKVGDIIKHQRVLYRVDSITWMKENQWGNQKVRAIRLVDGKAFKLYRAATQDMKQGYRKSTTAEGVYYTAGGQWITPTEDMIGQETDVIHIRHTEAERAAWLQWLAEREKIAIDQIVVKEC